MTDYNFEEVKKITMLSHGPVWTKGPCLRVGKKYVVINPIAAKAFGLGYHDSVVIMIDKNNNSFAFRKVRDESESGFRLTPDWGQDKPNGPLKIACQRALRELNAKVGAYYPLMLNSVMRLIVCDMRQELPQ